MAGRMRVAVMTVSDRRSAGVREDTAGPALVEMVVRELAAEVIATACVPDEVDAIAGQLGAWAGADPVPDLILTAGGTGLSSRDVTPEATLTLLERRHPGLMELVRARCGARTPMAYLSRGEAGTIGRTLVVNLPGSERAATESLEALLDVLPHAIETLRDEAEHHDLP
jgi:molybdenum cofactor synthesis domain-containing protein